MRTNRTGLLCGLLAMTVCGAIASAGRAQTTAPAWPEGRPPRDREAVFEIDGFQLTLIDRAPDAPAEPKQALIDTFFKVYPTLVRTYNPEATRKITLLIDPDYTGVAEAGGGRIRVSSKWITERPRDFDLITHEAMHLVQAYPGGAGPGWITEGIADYVRHVHGVDNAGGGWSLPDLRPAHKMTDSYRVTARFFLWLETRIKPGIVRALDQAMRQKRYADGFWAEQTGQAIEELWQRYQADPGLSAD